MTRIAYLGPSGTFTEEALLTQPDLASTELVPMRTMPDVLQAVADGHVELGFLPIENAIEGTVNLTLDGLIFDHDFMIQREVILPIHLHLAAPAGSSLVDIKRVHSFPVALAQSRLYLHDNLPDAQQVGASSTAEAARAVAEAANIGDAAICPALAAEQYGLTILASDIEDHAENCTRFLLLARHGIPAATGHDKTVVVCYQTEDRPGSLQGMLAEFSARGINLTKLESRTTKQALGSYCFIIELEGHIDEDVVADALMSVRSAQADVKFLGSFPAASPNAPTVRRDARARWRDAHDWLDQLRSQIR